MRSVNGRTLLAAMRAKRCDALYAISPVPLPAPKSESPARRRRRTRRLLLRALSTVPAESPCGGEFAQLMTNHFFGHVHAQMRTPIVHQKRIPDKIGRNLRPPRHSLYGL